MKYQLCRNASKNYLNDLFGFKWITLLYYFGMRRFKQFSPCRRNR